MPENTHRMIMKFLGGHEITLEVPSKAVKQIVDFKQDLGVNMLVSLDAPDGSLCFHIRDLIVLTYEPLK